METKLIIDGMTCMHCVSAVKQALENLPGVETARVSLEPGTALVSGEAELSDLIAAVNEEGFSVTSSS